MDELELIKQKINIVDLIQEYLPLKKSGINYKANCPFHQEKTPSFMVSPERGIWRCFGGCNKGGDIFKFMMEKDNLSFPEALEILAQKSGIVLERSNKKDKKQNEILFEIHQKAAQLYHYLLLEHKLGQKALDYLHKRGLTDETIKLFNLGYAPLSWDTLTKFLLKKGFKREDVISSGVAVESKNGCYDRFRGRIIFPLINIHDQIIGFSGRILSTGEPKYLNTPQTLIFDKSRFLYGLNLAKPTIRDQKEVVIVEGLLDMVLSFQSNIKNVVASQGTALTEGQIDLVKKYTNSLSLCFDTDFAGDNATRRGIEIADQGGLDIKVVKIKEGKDPADVCLKDPTLWQEAVKEATPIYDYYLQSSLKRYNPKLPSDKKAIAKELIPIWRKITDSITKEHYIEKLSALLQISPELLRQEVEKFEIELPKYQPIIPTNVIKSPDQPIFHDRRDLLEEYLLSLLFHLPKNHLYIPSFPETLFVNEQNRGLYVLLVLFLDSISFKAKSFKIEEFVKTLSPELVELTDKLYLIDIDEKLIEKVAWEEEVKLVVLQLKKMLLKASLEKLSLQIKSAQAFEQLETLGVLNKRFRDLSVKLKNL